MRPISFGFALLTAVLLSACAIDNPSDRRLPDAGPCGTMGAACCPQVATAPDGVRNVCSAAGTTCSSGTCVACGAPGQPCCAGSTTADGGTSMDASAAATCSGTNVCLSNVCVDCVGPDHAVCNGACVDLTTDQNCGACGVTCATAERCRRTASAGTDAGVVDGGAGDGGVARVAFCQIVCPPGQTLCGSVCRDLNADITNCGGCAVNCPAPPVGGTAVCSGGMCRVSILNCPGDRLDCNAVIDDGCEVSRLTDVTNCGACGNRCSDMGGTPSCVGGACTIACGADRGNCNGMSSDGCEIGFLTDVSNCGSCGHACALANVATNSCAAGACAVASAASCTTGFANCNNTAPDGCEVNLNVDNNNCGACGHVCGGGQVCAGGTCSTTCATTPGIVTCGSGATAYCANTTNDPNNCGTGMAGCGHVCSLPHTDTASCVASNCVPTMCAANFGNCDAMASTGCEANLQTDNNNCGGCGIACRGGQTCGAGTCQCPSGQTFCNGTCTNTTTDVNNCGPVGASSCGHACALANVATNSCAAGACAVASAASCTTGFANCNTTASDGCEVNLNVDSNNCGTCGRACGGGQVCSGGVCTTTCASPLLTCPAVGSAPSFCANTTNDPNNCGAGMAGCGRVCNLAHTDTEGCVASTCVPAGCSPGFGNCNNAPADGCEVNLQTDAANCGGCGRACATGQSCVAGACQCAAGQQVCGTACTTTNTDVNNCGGCGRVCALANVTTNSCAAGACAVASAASCATGFANCNTTASDGCEVNLNVDSNNCGACGRACGGGQVCSGGVCTTTCANPLLTCPAVGSTPAYCANTTNDPNNCGTGTAGCGRVCALANTTTNGCASGACVPVSCAANFGNCDGTAANGCETNLQTNTTPGATNCGTCGRTCATGQTCVAGACQCTTGQTLCGTACTTTNTDVNNCGSCGRVCALANVSTNSCVAGACAVGATACATGYRDCNGTASDGCEIDTRVDSRNCGGCGVACASGQVCSGGVCGTTCATGLATCGTGATAYCANTSIDPSNCGAGAAGCMRACTLANTATNGCVSGACVPVSCSTNFGNCDGTASNGCEASLTTTTNCGTCGRACVTGQTCVSGTCQCATGQTVCGTSCTNTNTDVNNCGGCGRICALANVTSNTCVAGACAVAGHCAAGYQDCDGLASNGCEVDTRVDSGHCGTCTTACGSGQVCSAGVCGASCGSPLSTCGTPPATYCANTANDPANCSACGTVCSLAHTDTHGCVTGACVPVACSTGFGNCDSVASNGCETNTQTSAANCGTCGRACPAGQVCTTGACGCPSGQTLCGSTCINLATDPLNCNTCGHACSLTGAATYTCSGGVCSEATCATGFSNCDGDATNGCETLLSDTNCGVCGMVCPGATHCTLMGSTYACTGP